MATGLTDLGTASVRQHLRFGWWSLLVFSTLGLILELLHGFKAALYLDAAQDSRRLMWTLAHAHGTLVAIIHLLFALALRAAPTLGGSRLHWISRCLIAASVLLPGGFFLAGIRVYAGDPGLGIALVPPGAVLLLIAIGLIARSSDTVSFAEPGPPPARREK